MNLKPIYLDYAATTPVDPRVLEIMLPFFTQNFGNASSKHTHGEIVKKAVDQAADQVADLINASSSNIIFTSGATEAINLALKGLYFQYYEETNKIITAKTEHKAVLDTCAYLEEMGAEVVYLNVDREGIIDWQQLKEELDANTLLVSIMHVNNETGVIQDIDKIAAAAKEVNAYFFTDATQSFGKLPIDVIESQIDLLSFSAHKIYGPKGIGGLYVRSGIKLQPLVHGGGQQKGLRAGTVNVPLIVGLGEVSRIAKSEQADDLVKVSNFRDELEQYLDNTDKVIINGKKAKRTPYISNFQLNTFEDAEDFLFKNQDVLSASTGSACNSEVIEPSHVLSSMGLEEGAASSIRISFGKFTEIHDVLVLIKLLKSL